MRLCRHRVATKPAVFVRAAGRVDQVGLYPRVGEGDRGHTRVNATRAQRVDQEARLRERAAADLQDTAQRSSHLLIVSEALQRLSDAIADVSSHAVPDLRLATLRRLPQRVVDPRDAIRLRVVAVVLARLTHAIALPPWARRLLELVLRLWAEEGSVARTFLRRHPAAADRALGDALTKVAVTTRAGFHGRAMHQSTDGVGEALDA